MFKVFILPPANMVDCADLFPFHFPRTRFCMKRRRNAVVCVYIVWESDRLPAPLRTDSPWTTGRRR